MKNDHISNPSTQSAAEQRALHVAEFLKEALETGLLIATGLWHFIPEDGSQSSVSRGYGQIDASAYRSLSIDYTESLIEDFGNLYALPDYPGTFTGKISYHDVTVPDTGLFALLTKTNGRRFFPVLQYHPNPAPNASLCVIEFDEEVTKVPLIQAEGRHRSLMAITMLLRWPNQCISPQLTSFLVRRDVNTTKKPVDEIEKNAKFSNQIHDISNRLFNEMIDLKIAHEELAGVLSASEGQDVYNWLPLSTPRVDVQRGKPTKTYSNRRDYEIKNMKDTLAEIDRLGGQKTANFLRMRLVYDQHWFTFRPNKPEP